MILDIYGDLSEKISLESLCANCEAKRDCPCDHEPFYDTDCVHEDIFAKLWKMCDDLEDYVEDKFS